MVSRWECLLASPLLSATSLNRSGSASWVSRIWAHFCPATVEYSTAVTRCCSPYSWFTVMRRGSYKCRGNYGQGGIAMSTQTATDFIRVGTLEEIKKKGCTVIKGADRPLAVFYHEGKVHA